MKAVTFPRGGSDIPHRKGATDKKPIVVLDAPEEVVIPLQQHIGAPCEPVVSVGDRVKLGQKIGESSAFVSAPIHASVSGEVIGVEERTLLDGRKVRCVVIKNDFKDELIEGGQKRRLDQVSAEEIRAIVKEAGIVGMGGAGFPTHVKIAPPKPVDTVIINGAECEPYLTVDHRLMVERAEEMIFGLRAIMKAVGANTGVIGIEVNKPDAIAKMKELINLDQRLKVVPLKVRYPQGAEKQLIKAVNGREVPSGALPLEVGCIVSNVHTAIAISEAITNGIPLYQRVVTVSGKCVADPRNLLVRIGTPLMNLLDFCGGLLAEPAVIVGGGPMTGPAVTTLDSPVVKNLSGVLFLAEDEIALDENRPCIKCARCVDVCPMGLTPNMLGLLSSLGKVEQAQKIHLMDCIECGLCSYICPSRRGLVNWIKAGKQELNARRAKERAV